MSFPGNYGLTNQATYPMHGTPQSFSGQVYMPPESDPMQTPAQSAVSYDPQNQTYMNGYGYPQQQTYAPQMNYSQTPYGDPSSTSRQAPHSQLAQQNGYEQPHVYQNNYGQGHPYPGALQMQNGYTSTVAGAQAPYYGGASPGASPAVSREPPVHAKEMDADFVERDFEPRTFLEAPDGKQFVEVRPNIFKLINLPPKFSQAPSPDPIIATSASASSSSSAPAQSASAAVSQPSPSLKPQEPSMAALGDALARATVSSPGAAKNKAIQLLIERVDAKINAIPKCQQFKAMNECVFGEKCARIHWIKGKNRPDYINICEEFFKKGECHKAKCLFPNIARDDLVCTKFLETKKCGHKEKCYRMHVILK